MAGGTGLIGTALTREYESLGHDVVSISRKEVDLTDEISTFKIISQLNPDILVDAAARVGGIGANNTQPVEFLIQNLKIQNNLMLAAYQAKVQKFAFLGSSCIYPRGCPQPIKEEYLLTGKLEETNSAYAIAKIAGVELIQSFRKEYGTQWISLMPTNLYGPHDNFALEGSHVLPAFVRKFVDAVKRDESRVELWGDGSAIREFLHVTDCAKAIVIAIEKYDEDMPLNIGSSEEISIKNLALLVSKLSGFKGEITWNKGMPNGTPRKILDSSRMHSLGWYPSISLRDGIASTIAWYKEATAKGVARR